MSGVVGKRPQVNWAHEVLIGETLGMHILKTSSQDKQQPPLHFWVVGLFFVLLHVLGIYDQVMLLSQNGTYFQQQNLGEAQIAYFTNYPLRF